MRYTASEKMEIIHLVEQSLCLYAALNRLGMRQSTFYNGLKRLETGGIDALSDNKPSPGIPWNKRPEDEQTAIIELALEKPELSVLLLDS